MDSYHFNPVEVDQDTIRNIWNSFDLGRKVPDGLVYVEIMPRYLDRPFTQIVKIRLPNGWVIGIAHRWKNNPDDEWYRPDPKRIRLFELIVGKLQRVVKTGLYQYAMTSSTNVNKVPNDV